MRHLNSYQWRGITRLIAGTYVPALVWAVFRLAFDWPGPLWLALALMLPVLLSFVVLLCIWLWLHIGQPIASIFFPALLPDGEPDDQSLSPGAAAPATAQATSQSVVK